MSGIIYKVTNTKTNQIYIGQTIKSLSARLKEHIHEARYQKTSYFDNAISKDNQNIFLSEVVEEVENEALLNEREIYYIDLYKANRKKYPNENHYNLTDGGRGIKGYKHSDETKEKIRNSSIGRKHSAESLEKCRLAKLGKKRSEETKAKISSSRIGMKVTLSEELKIKKREIIQETRKQYNMNTFEGSPNFRKDITIEKIEDLQKDGNTIEKIALILRCSKQAVNTRIKRKKLGL